MKNALISALALGFLLVILAGSVSADTCYQEFANVSAGCGDKNTGSYAYDAGWEGISTGTGEDIIDGNWSSGARLWINVSSAYLYINYTKPTRAVSADWQWQDGCTGLFNLSVPEQCFNASSTLQLYMSADQTWQNYYCNNGTDWVWLMNCSNIAVNRYEYEEAVWWNMTSCTPDWNCTGYDSCLNNDTQNCNAVTDLNLCEVPYAGDYSEFTPQVCDYCTPDEICDTWGLCQVNNTEPCLSVTDNNGCYAQTALPSDIPTNPAEWTPQACLFGWTYQENPNSTCVADCITSGVSYAYMNYTKLLDANPHSLWQLKHGGSPIYNTTIPYDCWMADNTTLSFRILSGHQGYVSQPSWTYPQCWNGTEWIQDGTNYTTSGADNGVGCGVDDSGGALFDGNWSSGMMFTSYHWIYCPSGDEGWKIYEEAMWWNTSCLPNWQCSDWNVCLANSTKTCRGVMDTNTCNESYVGDYSEITPESCTYVDVSSYDLYDIFDRNTTSPSLANAMKPSDAVWWLSGYGGGVIPDVLERRVFDGEMIVNASPDAYLYGFSLWNGVNFVPTPSDNYTFEWDYKPNSAGTAGGGFVVVYEALYKAFISIVGNGTIWCVPSGEQIVLNDSWHHFIIVENNIADTYSLYVDDVPVCVGVPNFNDGSLSGMEEGGHYAFETILGGGSGAYYTEQKIDNLVAYAGLPLSFCTPDWNCNGWGTCTNGSQPCNSVSDLNLCNESYSGNYSEFSPQSCSMPLYTPSYATGDLTGLTFDTLGSGLIAVLSLIGVIVLVNIIIWGLNRFKGGLR